MSYVFRRTWRHVGPVGYRPAVISNFRDVGGVRTADGRTVRTGLLFRSATLADLAPDGVALLADLGIRTVIDLRRATEVSEYGRVADAEGRRYVNLPPLHTPWVHHDGDEAAGAARFLADRYLELARDGGDAYAESLRLIAADGSAPVIVHCYAGKDRTGILIAFTLALIGVADADIAADYARSHDWSRGSAPLDMPAHWIAAPAEAILLFLTELRVAYGSVDAYAASIGLVETDIAALRRVLLG
jgi:protein tyrosine/serine phosphatase